MTADIRTIRKAVNLLNAEVRAGRIVKPKRCPECGRHARYRRIEAHHRDHSQPLDVEWVCSKCHGWLRERLLNWGDMHPGLRRDVQAKAKREGISLRALILKLLTDWLGR